MTDNLAAFAYLAASVCFILALKGLASPESSRAGNLSGVIGMVIAIGTTLLLPDVLSYGTIFAGVVIGGAVGTFIALRIQMTALPQLVAAFHSLVGMAAVLVAAAALYAPDAYGIGTVGHIKAVSLIEMSIGTAIGAITFTGSVVAFAKLQGLVGGSPLVFPGQHPLNALIAIGLVALTVTFAMSESYTAFWALAGLAFLLGFLLIVPIGGADMPVVISMLNSYSGWAACGIGFTLGNALLIITGALVGASGAILSYVMCKGMNRSFFSVILGGFGVSGEAASAAARAGDKAVKAGSAEDAAFIMRNASKVIVVPGYGLAVAQAQHELRKAMDNLEERGVDVKYAIHPVAGRMPGHMNVLLAEADVPYDKLFDLEEINEDFGRTDVVLVVGANDVVNPEAHNPESVIAGMPILDVDKAKSVIIMKRSLSPGFAGIDNPLFYMDHTLMFFGDAKSSMADLVREVREA